MDDYLLQEDNGIYIYNFFIMSLQSNKLFVINNYQIFFIYNSDTVEGEVPGYSILFNKRY